MCLPHTGASQERRQGCVTAYRGQPQDTWAMAQTGLLCHLGEKITLFQDGCLSPLFPTHTSAWPCHSPMSVALKIQCLFLHIGCHPLKRCPVELRCVEWLNGVRPPVSVLCLWSTGVWAGIQKLHVPLAGLPDDTEFDTSVLCFAHLGSAYLLGKRSWAPVEIPPCERCHLQF